MSKFHQIWLSLCRILYKVLLLNVVPVLVWVLVLSELQAPNLFLVIMIRVRLILPSPPAKLSPNLRVTPFPFLILNFMIPMIFLVVILLRVIPVTIWKRSLVTVPLRWVTRCKLALPLITPLFVYSFICLPAWCLYLVCFKHVKKNPNSIYKRVIY